MYVIDHLSVSQINMFSRCELQWFLKYVEGFRYPSSSALVRGKAVHIGLADIYTSIQREKRYYPDKTIDLVADYVSRSDRMEEVNWSDPKFKVKDIAVSLIKCYIDNQYPDKIEADSIESVEVKIQHVLYSDEGEKIKIIGYPDVTLTDKIIDFKTKSRKPSGIDIEYRFQTAFYSTALGKSKVELQYLISKKTPEIICLNTGINNNLKAISRNIFIKTYKKIKAGLQSGNFLPTGIFHPWACNLCGFKSIGKCPYDLRYAA